MVDLPEYVEKAVALEVLSAFMEELQYEIVNRHTRKQLDIIPLVANVARHRIDRLCQQLQNLLWRIGAIFPLAARFVLLNTPPRSAIHGLNYYFVNAPLIMVI